MKAVCVDCECEMRCEKNEVAVATAGSDCYRSGDKFKCPKCGKEIIIGFGTKIPNHDGQEIDITIRG